MTERDRNNVTNYKFDELVSKKNEEQVQLISSLVLIAGDKWNRKLKDRSFTCWEASILQFNTRLGLLSPFFGFQLYRSQGRSMDESIRIPQLSIYELCLVRSNWISLNIDKRQRHRVEEWNTLRSIVHSEILFKPFDQNSFFFWLWFNFIRGKFQFVFLYFDIHK